MSTIPTSVRMIAALGAAEFLGMTLWFSATAAASTITADYRLTPGETSWLTMAVQIGFVVGALASAMLNLPDVINPRRLMAAGCVLGALFNLGVTTADGAASLIAWRMATGAALAIVYPPGLKVAAGWSLNRGAALGFIVGALTIGSAFPHLLAWLGSTAAGTGQGAAGDPLDWRTMFRIASALAVLGAVIAIAVVRDGPHVAPTGRFRPRAVVELVRNRGVRLSVLGYLGHMWELYAMWTWFAAFAAASLQAAGASSPGRASLVTFVAIASGSAGCALAGVVADRAGKARVAGASMVVSAACSAIAGLVFGQSPVWLYALAIVWGFSIVADSAQFSALAAEHCPREYVGTTLAVQMGLGFLLTLVTIRLAPVVADAIGWRWTFALLVPGPALGVAAMARLGKGARLLSK